MTVFDERPTSASTRRRLPLLGLPVLALLIWAVAVHSPHGLSPQGIRQTLGEFRGDAPAEPGPDREMADALLSRRDLLMHPGRKFTPAQSRRLVGIAAGSASGELQSNQSQSNQSQSNQSQSNQSQSDQSQSEALDVLSLAQRAHALSPAQGREAEDAALQALRGTPGPMARIESARLLGHFGNPADAPALSALQGDSDPKVRQAAGEALARIAAAKS
jgi:hypothetical protein